MSDEQAKTEATDDSNHPAYHFHGACPPFAIFGQQIAAVTKIVDTYEDEFTDDDAVILNPAADLAVIGLVAYFEAFCKHQFAALLNIHPPILIPFSDKRPQASVLMSDLASMRVDSPPMLGFIIAERLDFGSGKLINGLFTDLLGVTPFSKSEVKRMDELLNDRHLLVHHGGIYTLKYARERGLEKTARGGVFFDSVGFSQETYLSWKGFFVKCAKKLVTVTVLALGKYAQDHGTALTYPADDALDRLLWGIDDRLGEALCL